MKIKAKIDRMVNSGNVKAIASVSLDGMFVVKNLKVMDGKKGLFVSMPQETFPGKDGQKKYSNLFFALTNSARLELQETVLQAYQQQIDPNYTPKQSYEEHSDRFPIRRRTAAKRHSSIPYSGLLFLRKEDKK